MAASPPYRLTICVPSSLLCLWPDFFCPLPQSDPFAWAREVDCFLSGLGTLSVIVGFLKAFTVAFGDVAGADGGNGRRLVAKSLRVCDSD